MVPVAILFIEVVVGSFFKSSHDCNLSHKARPSISILMPAHNESLVIERSIQSLIPQLQPQDRLLVIADNCTDNTANLAKELGVDVIERFNQNLRGKGYALDFGLQYIKNDNSEVLIIIDADCTVQEHTIDLLVLACIKSKRPVQALYLMESQPEPSLKSRIASFAWVVKNKVRPLGLKAMSLPCQLMGTGMAFLRDDIYKVNLASGNIVEDMKLGLDLTRINKAPLFLDQAVVTSIFPPSEEASTTQRARWEHGHLGVILSESPKLIFESVRSANLKMFALTCDLLVPPLALLTLMCLIFFVLSIIFANKLIIIFSITLLLSMFISVFLAWVKFGRSIISFKQLCYAPIYVLVKIPLYIKFFINRQVDWVRSKRD